MVQPLTCPSCGSQNNVVGQQFCGTCGARLPAFCPNCDAKLAQGQRFCETCGLEIVWAEHGPVAVWTRRQEASWFARHPNYILLLGLAIAILFATPLILLPDNATSLGWILLGIGILMYWSTAGWALAQKGQSLWHLCWILLGVIPIVGSLATLIIWLSLENRRA